MVKQGFSLAEALIVMMLISVLFAVGAKVMTTKPKVQMQTYRHGYFECYKSGEQMYQKYVRDKLEEDRKSTSECIFNPPPGAAFFNINSINPAPYSAIETNINTQLSIDITDSDIIIKNSENATTLSSNTDAESVKTFVNSLYKNSKIITNPGIIISW